jgi:serine/threonine protein kinase
MDRLGREGEKNMSRTSACPDSAVLRRLVLGQLAEAEAEPLEEHLAQCNRCAEVLQALQPRDPLVDAIQEARGAAGELPEGSLVEGLMQRLRALPSPCIGPGTEGQPLAPAAPAPVDDLPSHIGRFRVERLLGEGGLGRVFLAHDEQLRRPVAVKVPRPERACLPGHADSYLAEARILASLDHPHIVPVHDFGQTEDGLPFVVSKFIESTDLATTLRHARPSFATAAELVATVAEALHYAHRRGLVHRDIKPENILLDTGGRPYVADFGLALREEDFGKGAGLAGTPAYMSPELARGEGHRVDGRSDLFSLGVVFYELLTGRRPFRADTREELLEQITAVEARPLRQVDDSIPGELERICLKALAKRATERYPTGLDLADDLRHFLDESASAETPRAPAGVAAAERTTPTPLPVKVVPKGLRSFDAGDADFFLELLPGPLDREGLPESIRFWKTRIEETDTNHTFAVGLIYGPSGCGKSSLVKAGLLPRLSDHVLAVSLEATAGETETRLLNGLRKRCPSLPASLGLKEALAALRRGQGIPGGKKVLIVLDQFEQWLHARREEQNTELVQALRQCGGGAAAVPRPGARCFLAGGQPVLCAKSKSIWLPARTLPWWTCSTRTMPGKCWRLLGVPLANSRRMPLQ